MQRWSPPIPIGIFLDRSVVALLEDHADHVFDGYEPDPALPAQLLTQIEALHVLMVVAGRGEWPFAVSPAVIAQGPTWYARDVAEHWRLARAAWGIEERGLAPMTLVAMLPRKDQVILAEAYRSGCEAVLTNDLKWVKPAHARTIAALGMLAYTPETLLVYLSPWLKLWL